ncbi:hypothetical protein CDFC105_32562 [Clostridioides difficile]|nr:hypothetical protein CDFC105_32562 [Clostridioides difficile]
MGEVFFFQAEDGIRDAQESRGLGDVYKRQVIYCEDNKKAIEDLTLEELHKFSDAFKEDIYDFIDYELSLIHI